MKTTFFCYSELDCRCTAEYSITVQIDGVDTLVEAFCNTWGPETDPNTPFCYLSGGFGAENCPGAQISNRGAYYWSADEKFCKNTCMLTFG